MPKIIENSSHIEYRGNLHKVLVAYFASSTSVSLQLSKGGGGGSVSWFTTVAQGRGEGAARKEDLVVVTLIDKDTIQY